MKSPLSWRSKKKEGKGQKSIGGTILKRLYGRETKTVIGD